MSWSSRHLPFIFGQDETAVIIAWNMNQITWTQQLSSDDSYRHLARPLAPKMSTYVVYHDSFLSQWPRLETVSFPLACVTLLTWFRLSYTLSMLHPHHEHARLRLLDSRRTICLELKSGVWKSSVGEPLDKNNVLCTETIHLLMHSFFFI